MFAVVFDKGREVQWSAAELGAFLDTQGQYTTGPGYIAGRGWTVVVGFTGHDVADVYELRRASGIDLTAGFRLLSRTGSYAEIGGAS